jgi:hypothetical protein
MCVLVHVYFKHFHIIHYSLLVYLVVKLFAELSQYLIFLLQPLIYWLPQHLWTRSWQVWINIFIGECLILRWWHSNIFSLILKILRGSQLCIVLVVNHFNHLCFLQLLIGTINWGNILLVCTILMVLPQLCRLSFLVFAWNGIGLHDYVVWLHYLRTSQSLCIL